MTHGTLDFELYSEAGFVWNDPTPEKPLGFWGALPGAPSGKKGLPVVNAAAYMEHPSTEILTLSYDVGDGIRRWRPGWPDPVDLWAHVAAGGLLEAHYSLFEFMAWMVVCARRYGWPPILKLHQMRCSMATAHVNNLPGALGNLGDVLNLDVRKDKDGTALLKKLSVPRNPTKGDPRRRIRPEDDPALVDALHRYNDFDVLSEQSASRHPSMEPMSDAELGAWLMDQEMNWRGLGVDRQGVRDCIAVLDQILQRYGDECRSITGGIGPSQVEALRGWLSANGLSLGSLDADAVEAALARTDLTPDVRRVLETRALSGSASVKKLYAMENQCCADDRLRGLLTHHGARTGRPTGEGPQPLNLPRNGPKLATCAGCGNPFHPKHLKCPWCGALRGPDPKKKWAPEMIEPVLSIMATRLLDVVEHYFGDAMLAILGCLRGLLCASDGMELIASDYSSIEAVVTAMLSGEQWRIEAFQRGDPMYLISASKITGRPVEEYLAYHEQHGEHHPDRQNIGKVAELACFGPQTQVLTQRGYVAMEDVRISDKLWDGVEWVKHRGLLFRGIRNVIPVDGVLITPEHLVNTKGSWRPAFELASNENTLSLALATGSETLPWSAIRRPHATFKSKSSVLAARNLISSLGAILERGRLLDARLVGVGTRRTVDRKNSGSTLAYAPILSIVAGFLTGYRRVLADAAPQEKAHRGKITEAEESASGGLGGSLPTESAHSSHMLSLSKDGTTHPWNWTVSTWMGITNRAISALFRDLKIRGTKGPSKKCKNESTIWSPVYDIALAGPRNRFTIRSNSGHLLVHNCGYGGWVGAWRVFDDSGKYPDEEVKAQIKAWRAASPAIVEMWGGQWRGAPWDGYPELYGVEGAAIAAIQNPGQRFDFRGIGFDVRFDGTRSKLVITLPSGRPLVYWEPLLTPSTREWATPGELSISYMTWNSNPKYGSMGWVRMPTFGGRLTENIVQAVAHDIQRYGAKLLRMHGYPLVLWVYDENVCEVPLGFGSIEEFERLMGTMPWWAADWPIRAAGGWRGKRYRKAA